MMWSLFWNVREDCLSWHSHGVRGDFDRPTQWQLSLLKAYNQVEGVLHNRRILPGEAGVMYSAGSCHLLWAFRDLELPLDGETSIHDLLSDTTFASKYLSVRPGYSPIAGGSVTGVDPGNEGGTSMANEVSEKVLKAKAAAVADFLPKAAPKAEFAALAAATSPRQNVVGVGIGPKIKDGKEMAKTSIRFYVERKVIKSSIAKADQLPKEIDGVPTDVVETGRLYAQVPIAQQRLRPTKGGCSVGFQGKGFVMAGTLGCLVTDGTKRFILSNNHVLADENTLPLGSPIFQPGTLDGGRVPSDRVAKLAKFIKIKPVPFRNKVDAAIALLTSSAIGSPVILPAVGSLGSTVPLTATVGMLVHKHGRTTGYTKGKVIDVAADVNIGYDFGTARFEDQIVIVGSPGSFSDSGDSGSLIVRRSGNRAIGLLFAGSTSHTIANHIGDVLTALSVRLLA